MDLNQTAATDGSTKKLSPHRDRNKIWTLPQNSTPQDKQAWERIAATLGIDPICARVLYHRGYTNEESMLAFLKQSEEKCTTLFS